MKHLLLYLMSGLLLLAHKSGHAQKIFSEGLIKYDVYQNNESKPSGIYVVTIKGGNIKRELAMKNGFNNISIFHFKTGISYTLSLDDNNKYALELKPEEVKLKNKKFENAAITPENNTKKICGYNTVSAKVEYQDKDIVNIFFTKELTPQNESFNTQFPGLVGIPLEYEVKGNGGMKMKFIAAMVETKVVDSQIFDIPSDYKIVSKEELEKMK